MKRTLLALSLFLIFSGCLAAPGPMGATKESGSGIDEGGVPSNVFEPPSPAAAEPSSDGSSAEDPTPPVITMMGSLPSGGDSPSSGSPAIGSHEIASAAPQGLIDPKTEQANAGSGLQCLNSYRLRIQSKSDPSYFAYICSGNTPETVALQGFGNETINYKFLLEKCADDGCSRLDIKPDGCQVRLVYQPLGDEAWESSFVDTTAAASPDGSNNVFFPPILVGSGYVGIYLYEPQGSPAMTADFQPVFKPFADKSAYDAFVAEKFIPIGSLELFTKTATMKKRLAPATQTEQLHRTILKYTSPSPP